MKTLRHFSADPTTRLVAAVLLTSVLAVACGKDEKAAAAEGAAASPAATAAEPTAAGAAPAAAKPAMTVTTARPETASLALQLQANGNIAAWQEASVGTEANGLRLADVRAASGLADDLDAALRPFVPDFAFRLIQLAEIPFEAIAGTPAGIMILRTLKAERSGDLLADPVWDESLLDRLPRLIFEMLLGYILRADIDKTDFDNKIKLFQKAETRTTAMSLAEQLRQEGHLAGRQEAVLAYLEIRFGPVPHGLVEAMRQVADLARLESLQRVSFTCASIEEFAAAL